MRTFRVPAPAEEEGTLQGVEGATARLVPTWPSDLRDGDAPPALRNNVLTVPGFTHGLAARIEKPQ
jgi:hypothetical protein